MSVAPPTSPIDLAGGRWPIVGRGPLLAALRHALAGRGAVLMGAPGVGKTVLADAAVPRPAGHLVGDPGGADRPLWAVRALSPDATGIEEAAADAAAALRDGHRGAGAPVLRIDDLDLLDAASSAVVARLAATGAARVVATRRDGPAPEAAAVLWREVGLQRLEVPPLDEDDTATVVADALGGLLDGRVATAIWTLSGGNPQVVRDLVVGSVLGGSLRCTEGFWRLVGPPSVTGPTAERVAGVLARLDGSERELVEVLALTGPVPLAIAERLGPLATLERLERAGLVAVEPSGAGRVSLADPALATAVDAGLPALTRRRLSGLAADAHDAAPAGEAAEAADRSLSLRAATWRVDAGRRPPAAELVAAARLAVDQRDTVLGERLAGLAVDVGGGAEAVLLQSWCADEHGSTEVAARVLDAYQPGDDAERVALAIRRAEQRYWAERDVEGAASILAESEAVAAEPWSLAPRAQAAVFAALDGRPAAALEAAEPLIEHPEPQVGSTAALAATIALAVLDRPETAQGIAEQAMAELADASASLFIDPGVHIIGLLFALQGQGRLVEADELVTAVYRHTLTRPGHQAQGWAAMLRAYVLLARGRPTDAAEAAQEAELVWDSARLQGPARWSATIAALALGECGDRPGAEAALARVDGRDGRGFALFAPEVHRARAWLALRQGNDPVPELQAAAELALGHGIGSLAATAGHDLVRVGAAETATAVFDRLAPGSPTTETRRGLARAAAKRDVAGMLAAADEFDRFGAAGWAAEARALAVADDPRRAASVRPSVVELVDETGLATPPLVTLIAEPEPAPAASVLTTREREVAVLAASGLSNREIAERLVVSLRTVENHLHRAFAKLGVTSRSELADHVPSTASS